MRESEVTKTNLMEQSNHILQENDSIPVSRNYFEEERNTVMAGDLRDQNHQQRRQLHEQVAKTASTP